MIYLGRRIGREVFFVLFSSSRKEGYFIHRGCIIYIYIYIFMGGKKDKKKDPKNIDIKMGGQNIFVCHLRQLMSL